MRIWVDLVNSPQVLVLAPVIRRLEAMGHEVDITTRDFAQTIGLAERQGLRHQPLGRHGGFQRAGAARANIERTRLLLPYLRRRCPDLAFSHNSYSQLLAAWLRRIPTATMMDYEHHRANHLAFRLARLVIVPAAFPDWAVRRFGARDKVRRYPGIKEQLYLDDFSPDPGFLNSARIPARRPLVVARPPGTWGDYYKGAGKLFEAFLERVRAHPTAFVVLLPRIPEQARLVAGWPAGRALVPDQVVDGPNLLHHADLVVSGGGTMNREAAVLGTPALTVFEGDLGEVDRWLVAAGRLSVAASIGDVEAFPIRPKNGVVARLRPQGRLVDFIADSVLSARSTHEAELRTTA